MQIILFLGIGSFSPFGKDLFTKEPYVPYVLWVFVYLCISHLGFGRILVLIMQVACHCLSFTGQNKMPSLLPCYFYFPASTLPNYSHP